MITPFDVTIVFFLSTILGILLCECYHLMRIYDET